MYANSVIPAVIAEDLHLGFDGDAGTIVSVIITQSAIASRYHFALLSAVHVFLHFWFRSKAIGLTVVYHIKGRQSILPPAYAVISGVFFCSVMG